MMSQRRRRPPPAAVQDAKLWLPVAILLTVVALAWSGVAWWKALAIGLLLGLVAVVIWMIFLVAGQRLGAPRQHDHDPPEDRL
jgi:hypothetical protein